MRRRGLCLLLALLTAASCTGAAWAAGPAPAAEPLYCHGHGGGHHGGRGRHGSRETCGWLFHAWEDCEDVNCTEESHAHRCPTDCAVEEHDHYGVCRYQDGTLQLVRRK